MGIVNVDFSHIDDAKREARFRVMLREGTQKTVQYVEQFFDPYFYVTDEENLNIVTPHLRKFIAKVEKGFVSYFGEKLKKIVLTPIHKDEFNELKKCFDRTWEDDVLYRWRYIIDNKIWFDPNQRILYFDIETDRGKDAQKADKAITSICAFDSFSKRYMTMVWHPAIKEDSSKKLENETIYYFTDEVKMLRKFVEFVSKNVKPDVMSGWNIWHYDLPYLFNRMRIFHVNINELSPLRKAFTMVGRNGQAFTRIYGVECMDLLKIYDKVAYYDRAPNLRLDTVGNHVLKMRKIKVDPECWAQGDYEALIEYNKRDVEICAKLDEKMGLISYFLSLQQLVPGPLEDLFWNSKVIDLYLLHKYHDKFVFPSKRQHQRVEFEGGLVIAPPAKIFKNVACFDFSGMYTSIFISFNLSPELVKNKIENEYDIKIDDIVFDGTKRGFIPEVLDELRKGREKMVELRDKCKIGSVEYMALDERQGTYKSILNSVMGDTLVWVADKNMNISCKEIKNVNISVDKFALSMNRLTKRLEWKPLLKVWKHVDKDRKILRIRTKYSNSVKITPEHALFIEKDNQIKEIAGKDLKIGDKVIVVNQYQQGKCFEYETLKVKWIEHLHNPSIYVYDLSVKDNENFVGGECGNFLIHNSFYGVFGFTGFRMFDWRVGKSVTYIGRQMLMYLKKIIDEKKYPIVLGDTDSIYAQFPEEWDADQCIKEAEKLEKEINDRFVDFHKSIVKNPAWKSIIQVDCEHIYSRVITFGVKKKYAGVQIVHKKRTLDKPKFKYVGVELIRRNTPLPIRDVLKKAFEMILVGEDSAKVNVFLEENKQRVMNLPLFEIGIPVGITKDFSEYKSNAQHIVAFKNSNELLDTGFQTFDKGRMIYVKNVSLDKKYNVTEIVLDEDTKLPDNFVVDWDRYWEKALYDRLAPFKKVSGLKLAFNYVPIGQKTLAAFMEGS